MDIISLYEDAARDSANKNENGYFSYAMFNRMLPRASNRLLDYITGDQSGVTPPLSYSTQKAKDFISFLITKFPTLISNATIQRPSDYYSYDNLFILSLNEQQGCSIDNSDCDTVTPKEKIIKTPVEILDGQQFYTRCQTNIKGLKPSVKKPICKMVGNTIEFEPQDLGSCVLEYIRYPIAGEIKTVFDSVYNDDIADPLTSIDCEWPEFAREPLIYFLTQQFATHISETALYQMNNASGKK